MNLATYRKPLLSMAALALGVGILVPTAGFVATRLERPAPTEGPVAPALAVAVLAAEPTDGYELRRVFTGQVEANRTSGLGFERAGLLRQVMVAEGESVAAGQVLARLDTALLEAGQQELNAALASAEADLALAEATLKRYRGSIDQGAVTGQALDEAREGASVARAAVELARARIASVDLDIAKSELRAPFEGVIIRRLADEGRVLGSGSPVVELQERATPEVRVGVAGPLADSLVAGVIYPLVWRGHTLPARLRALLPVRAAGTRTIDALFVPIDTPAGLRPGELVDLRLSERVPERGIWLPVSALTEGIRGLWQAYAVEPLTEKGAADLAADHRIRPLPVEVLYQDGDRVYVQGPLDSDTRVVGGGLQRVVPGQLVRVLPPAAVEVAMGGR